MNRKVNYGDTVIIRCAEMYDRRFCPICGTCSCRREVEGRRLVWAPAGTDPGCPMHGPETDHWRVKVVTARRELRSHRIIRMGVQDRLSR